MKRIIPGGLYVAVFGLALLSAGCATYYRVTDPASGRVYYTEKVSTERGGAVRLKDARSKSDITLQNSEVTEISKDEYKKGLATPVGVPAPAAAPAATPAPATAPAPAAVPAAVPAEGAESK